QSSRSCPRYSKSSSMKPLKIESMAEDLYIKNLMRKVRTGDKPQIEREKEVPTKFSKEEEQELEKIKEIIRQARSYTIIGDKKRPIKVDKKNEEVLKMLYPVFGVDVSRFINLLVARFIVANPQ